MNPLMNSVGSNTEGKLNCINAVVITHNNKSRQQTGLVFLPAASQRECSDFLPEIGGAGDLSMQKLLQFSQKTDFNLVMLMGNDNFKIRVLLSILVEDLL